MLDRIKSIELNILSRQNDSFFGCINRVNGFGTSLQRINRKSTSIAKCIDRLFILRKLPQQVSILSLIKKKARLLTQLPIHIKFIAVLIYYVWHHTHPEKVFAIFASFLRSIFIIDSMQGITVNTFQSTRNFFSISLHACGVCLYNGNAIVHIDDQPRKAITLGMNEA